VNELNIELNPQSISDLQSLLDNTVEDPEITGVSASLVQRENMLCFYLKDSDGNGGYATSRKGRFEPRSRCK